MSGIMANRFRILQTPTKIIVLNKAVKIVLACTLFHNYLRREYTNEYIYRTERFDREHEESIVVEGS